MPQFVKDEFHAFLECGILAHGFLRLRCAGCGHEKLVAFSCKRRGICPSCGARRMAEIVPRLRSARLSAFSTTAAQTHPYDARRRAADGAWEFR